MAGETVQQRKVPALHAVDLSVISNTTDDPLSPSPVVILEDRVRHKL